MVSTRQEFVLLFFAYSALGWLMEMFYMSIKERRISNRGFLVGPCCPIYGVGLTAITILFQDCRLSFWYVFFSIMILCSVLEYAVSVILERIFHTRWWDYHDMRFNIRGRICLETLLPFGILGTFALYRINPMLLMFYHRLPAFVAEKLLIGVVFAFVIDFMVSVWTLHQIVLPEGEADHTAEISRRVWRAITKRF